MARRLILALVRQKFATTRNLVTNPPLGRLTTVAAVTDDENLEFTLRMMSKKAQTLRRQIEERLGVRN